MSDIETEAKRLSDLRQSYIGKHCFFVDPVQKEHAAVITAVHSLLGDESGPWNVNLVWVSDDVQKHDPYGQQIERNTSVPHKSMAGANGMYFYMPSEQLVAG